jgi:hypothetical protein
LDDGKITVSRISLDPKDSAVTESQFAEFFGIAPGHVLKCVRYEALFMDVSEWEHEERDAAGQLVARYVTSFALDDSGASARFQKYGADGALLAQKPMPMERFLSAMSKSS